MEFMNDNFARGEKKKRPLKLTHLTWICSCQTQQTNEKAQDEETASTLNIHKCHFCIELVTCNLLKDTRGNSFD